jgi:hypothetical protein
MLIPISYCSPIQPSHDESDSSPSRRYPPPWPRHHNYVDDEEEEEEKEQKEEEDYKANEDLSEKDAAKSSSISSINSDDDNAVPPISPTQPSTPPMQRQTRTMMRLKEAGGIKPSTSTQPKAIKNQDGYKGIRSCICNVKDLSFSSNAFLIPLILPVYILSWVMFLFMSNIVHSFIQHDQ